MERKVISLHKNLQGPRTPNIEAIHTKPEKLEKHKKKRSSQASLKQKNSKQKSVNSNTKGQKGDVSPHNKKSKSKSKPKNLKKSLSKVNSSQLCKQKKNLYTGDDKGKENFLETITEKSFSNLQTLKLNLLSYIFKKRLVRDQQYNELYENLVQRFPDKEDIVKVMLFQIVSTLDS